MAFWVAPACDNVFLITLYAMEPMGAIETEGITTSPSLDLHSATEARLAGCARRMSQLLKSPAVTANAEAQSSRDDFRGAVYALIRAKHEGFRDRAAQSLSGPLRSAPHASPPTTSRRKAFGSPGFISTTRCFAQPKSTAACSKLSPAATAMSPHYCQKARKEHPSWTSAELSKVHDQVNELKHDPRGIYHGRAVTYAEALAAACELLDLIEA